MTPEQEAKCRERKRYFRGCYSAYPSEPCSNAVCIPLTKGRHVLLDSEDFPLVGNLMWHTDCNGYARADIRNKETQAHYLLHRLVMGSPIDMQVDHKDGNRLDNRRINLRLCTKLQNARNRRKSWTSSSRFKGVMKYRNGWRAYIHVNNVDICLGVHRDEVIAAMAYNAAAIHHYGEFAAINQISEGAAHGF